MCLAGEIARVGHAREGVEDVGAHRGLGAGGVLDEVGGSVQRLSLE